MDDYVPEHAAEENDEEPIIGDAPPAQNVLLSSNIYDKLKPVAQIWLPALAVFYITIAPYWGLPKQEEVAGTIMALDLLLGAVLGISSRQYVNKVQGKLVGFMDVHYTERGKQVQLKFPGDPQNIDQHDRVTFKVRKR